MSIPAPKAMQSRSDKERKAGLVHRQVTVLIAKHEALLDEEALSEMRAAADEKQAESLAIKGDSPEDLVRVSLVARKEASPLSPSKAQILSNQKAKVTMLLLLPKRSVLQMRCPQL